MDGLRSEQNAASAEQKNAIASLCGDIQGLADKLNQMGNAFEKEVGDWRMNSSRPWTYG